jgi:1,2-phenylacetyl-CoA epoxidase catalytic subunit
MHKLKFSRFIKLEGQQVQETIKHQRQTKDIYNFVFALPNSLNFKVILRNFLSKLKKIKNK